MLSPTRFEGVRARMTTAHDCPGGCGQQVSRTKFACLICWRRLPADLRRPITRLHNRDLLGHIQAMSDARRWYRETARDRPRPRRGLAQ